MSVEGGPGLAQGPCRLGGLAGKPVAGPRLIAAGVEDRHQARDGDVLGIPVFLLVRWHARTTAYRCPACGHEFVISAWTDFVTPHIPGKKYVACPSCGVKGWARVLMREGGTAGAARKGT